MMRSAITRRLDGGLYLQRPCCLEVDRQLKFRWLLNGQIGWLAPFKILLTKTAAVRKTSS